jgi:N-formylglutamate amidohydrolase
MVTVTWTQLIVVLLVQLYVVYRFTSPRYGQPTESTHTMKIEIDKASIDASRREVEILNERIAKLTESAAKYNSMASGTNIK